MTWPRSGSLRSARMRTGPLLAGWLLAAGTAVAADPLRVQLDCYLPTGPVRCPELSDAYFASATFLMPTLTAAEAALRIELRVAPTGDPRFHRYRVRVEGPVVTPAYSREVAIPLELPPTAALVRVLVALQAMTAPQLALEEPGHTDASGRWVLALTPPAEGSATSGVASAAPSTATDEEATAEATSPWYHSASLFGTASLGDANTSLNGNVGYDVNYSAPQWRVRASTNVDFQHVRVRLGDVDETQQIFAAGAKAVVARTILDGWSAALLGGASHAPAENLALEQRVSLGIAWDLVPFMRQQGNSVGIQYQLGATYQDYLRRNLFERDEDTFLHHALDLSANWHHERADLSAYLGVWTVVLDNRFHRIAGGVTWSYRFTARFALSLNVDASYRRALLNQPLDSLIDTELEQFLAGAKFSTLQVLAGVTLRYTLGNSALRSRDQRWKNY